MINLHIKCIKRVRRIEIKTQNGKKGIHLTLILCCSPFIFDSFHFACVAPLQLFDPVQVPIFFFWFFFFFARLIGLHLLSVEWPREHQ